VRARIGRKGAFLATFGSVFVLLSFSTPDPLPMHTFARAIMPLPWWSAGFGAAGAVAIVAGLLPPVRKTIGFVSLQFISSMWGMALLVSALFDDAGVLAARAAAIWLVVTVSFHIVSGLEEPSRRRPPGLISGAERS
jgi:hypothetical protein